jgi:hypothetical protein
MPMVWNSDADAKVCPDSLPSSTLETTESRSLTAVQLFAAVLQTSEVKVDYAKVAEIMGHGKSQRTLPCHLRLLLSLSGSLLLFSRS